MNVSPAGGLLFCELKCFLFCRGVRTDCSSGGHAILWYRDLPRYHNEPSWLPIAHDGEWGCSVHMAPSPKREREGHKPLETKKLQVWFHWEHSPVLLPAFALIWVVSPLFQCFETSYCKRSRLFEHHSRFVLCQAKRDVTKYFTCTLCVWKFLALPSLFPVPTNLDGADLGEGWRGASIIDLDL